MINILDITAEYLNINPEYPFFSKYTRIEN